MVNLPFKPKWSRNWIEKKLSRNYYKKPYDRFMWWRGYTPINKALNKKEDLRERIMNGDFEQGPYLMELELCLHTMNDKFKEAITTKGEPDHNLWHTNTSIDRARKKRLEEDHEKEEFKKLTDLRDEFVKEFKMSLDEYEAEVNKTSGTTLEFYFEMEEKYGKRVVRLKKIPKS
ncbi:hypothetical protein N8445_00470 [bacterium]|nr:hypothetical protein [bacterium]